MTRYELLVLYDVLANESDALWRAVARDGVLGIGIAHLPDLTPCLCVDVAIATDPWILQFRSRRGRTLSIHVLPRMAVQLRSFASTASNHFVDPEGSLDL